MGCEGGGVEIDYDAAIAIMMMSTMMITAAIMIMTWEGVQTGV